MWFASLCRAIWCKLRGHLMQIVDWFDAEYMMFWRRLACEMPILKFSFASFCYWKSIFSVYFLQMVKMKRHVFLGKIYPQGSRKGEIAWMICESVSSVFWPFRRKTSKRRGYTNFGQSSVTKTLPPPLQVRIGKSGNEHCKIRPEFRGLPPAKVLRWKETGK